MVVRLVRTTTVSPARGDYRRRQAAPLVGRGEGRIVAESLDPATTVSAVARRYGLHASQLFVWRQRFAGPAARDAPEFVPVVVNEGAGDIGRMAGRIEVALGPAWCGSARTWTPRRCAGARGGAGPGVIAVPPECASCLRPGRSTSARAWTGWRPGAAGAAGRPVRGRRVHLPPQGADRVKILVYDGTGLVVSWSCCLSKAGPRRGRSVATGARHHRRTGSGGSRPPARR
jgi:hypothetical protein